MFRNPLTIGVDIGHHSIKAVVLRQKKSAMELVAFAEVVLPAPVLNKQHNVNAPVLLSAMRKLKKALPFGARNAALALPDSAVISKVIQLDSHLTDDESVFAVEQAISASSPFPVEELRLDFFPMVDEVYSEKAQTHPVQVYATRKDTVDSRVEVMRQARFEPTVMELQAHALVWLEQYLAGQQGGEGNWGIVDIGHSTTAIGVKGPAGTVYRREVSFGCEEVLEQGEPVMSIDGGNTARAEQFTKLLADNLKRQLQLYRTTYPRSTLEGIWLAGGGQSLVLEDMLARMLSLSVRKIHPLAGFQRSAKLDQTMEETACGQYAVAAGLAIRGASL